MHASVGAGMTYALAHSTKFLATSGRDRAVVGGSGVGCRNKVNVLTLSTAVGVVVSCIPSQSTAGGVGVAANAMSGVRAVGKAARVRCTSKTWASVRVLTSGACQVAALAASIARVVVGAAIASSGGCVVAPAH